MLRIPKLRDRSLQLLVFRVAGFQVLSRIVIRRNELIDRQRLNDHPVFLSTRFFVSRHARQEDSLQAPALAAFFVAGSSGDGILAIG